MIALCKNNQSNIPDSKVHRKGASHMYQLIHPGSWGHLCNQLFWTSNILSLLCKHYFPACQTQLALSKYIQPHSVQEFCPHLFSNMVPRTEQKTLEKSHSEKVKYTRISASLNSLLDKFSVTLKWPISLFKKILFIAHFSEVLCAFLQCFLSPSSLSFSSIY